MRKLLVLLILSAAVPCLAENDPKPAEIPCAVRVEMLEAKLAALQARLNSLGAFVELLKTQPGLQYTMLEAQGNELLKPFQAAIEKGSEACGEGFDVDPQTLKCRKKPPPQSNPEASAP